MKGHEEFPGDRESFPLGALWRKKDYGICGGGYDGAFLNGVRVGGGIRMKVDAGNVRELAERAADGNWELRQFLKMRSAGGKLDRLVAAITDRVWAGVDCTACANCCKDLGIGLTEEEAARMARGMGLSVQEFGAKHLEAAEALARSEGVPRKMRGPCPMLKDNRCTVYEDRPNQCRKYPYLHEKNFVFRTLGMIERTYTCPIVYEVFEELKAEYGIGGRGRPPRRWR
jgi:uncharacterized protein